MSYYLLGLSFVLGAVVKQISFEQFINLPFIGRISKLSDNTIKTGGCWYIIGLRGGLVKPHLSWIWTLATDIFIDGVDVVEVDAGGWPIVIWTPVCCHNVAQSRLVLQPSSSRGQMNFGRFVGLGYRLTSSPLQNYTIVPTLAPQCC